MQSIIQLAPPLALSGRVRAFGRLAVPWRRVHRLPEATPQEPETEEEEEISFGGLFGKRQKGGLYGEWVDPNIPLPPEYEKDFWEDPKFEFLGVMMQYFIPFLVVMSLIVGGIAAKSFNEGATSYLQPASETTSAEILPVQE